MSWDRDAIARRALAELPAGGVVNLGIGLPTLVANLLPPDADVLLHTENGILGMGPYPTEAELDPQVINAGKETVTIRPGGATFGSHTSFAMIRGGHVDLALLGAMQVAANGDLANWRVPGGRLIGIGGAMDLAAGAKRVVVLMRHRAKDGAPKLVDRCTFPLTALAAVDRVITDLGVLEPRGDGFAVLEIAPGVTLDAIRTATRAPIVG